MGVDFVAIPAGFGVNRDDDTLAAGFGGAAPNHIRVGHRGGIDGDLVSAGAEQGDHIFRAAHTAANRQRHEALLGRARDGFHQCASPFMSGGNIEEAELICALRVIGFGEGHRIPRIAQTDEVYTFHGAPVFHVEAGNDASFEGHYGLSSLSSSFGLRKLPSNGLMNITSITRHMGPQTMYTDHFGSRPLEKRS